MNITRIGSLVAGLVVLIAIFLAIPAWRRVARDSRRAACLQNLSVIGRAMSDYVRQSGGHWPYVAKLPSMEYHTPAWPSLPTVLAPFMGGQQDRFRCPSDERNLETGSPLLKRFPARTTFFETEGTSYEWTLQELYAGGMVGHDPLAKAEGFGLGPADQPIVWEFRPFHGDPNEAGSMNVLYADFRARPIRAAAAETGGP